MTHAWSLDLPIAVAVAAAARATAAVIHPSRPLVIMYLIADLIRSTSSSFELRTKRDHAPVSPPSCGTTLAKGARFTAYHFGSYVSRCAPLTSVTALDPPRRLTTSPSCEIAYPRLAEWHAEHADASSLDPEGSRRTRAKRSKRMRDGRTKRAT